MTALRRLLSIGLVLAVVSCVSTEVVPLSPSHPASTLAPEAPQKRTEFGLGSDPDSQRTKELLSQTGHISQSEGQQKPVQESGQNHESMPGMDMSGH